MTRRRVTPVSKPNVLCLMLTADSTVTKIYPTEANLIVSLLDIHVSSIPPDTETLTPPPLEILEAGTGHGSLTLHLARAIHAANQPPPQLPGSFENEEEYEHHIRPWKENRRAIVHTIDLDQAHSNHARQIVRDFRRRLYSHHVDFHIGDVSEWLNREMASRQETSFLSYCLLDLPAAHDHLSTVAQALNTHGIVTAFNPSITQIAECVRTIRDLRLPLVLEKVVELGAGAGTGGRQWDVRIAKVRHPGRQKKKQVIQASSDGSSGAKSTHPGDVTEDDLSSNILSDLPRGDAEGVENPVSDLSDDQDASPTSDELPDMSISSEAAGTPERTEMVCRPTVGNMVVGGGFLGVWRKMRKGDVLDDL
ncbi:MAG: hypothetical protein M1825_004862 [Sarcosagium campestre]|nr:MAG: hypothetical protein M1825_004862 [Sarcosagium campestre]